MYRHEFNQGTPQGCIDWLWENVGVGNIDPKDPKFNTEVFLKRAERSPYEDDWFYERVFHPRIGSQCGEGRSVPTIVIKDEKKAMLFILRWA